MMGKERAMGTEPYVKPTFKRISAEEVESIASAVGSAPPPPPPPPGSYNIHILFSAIKIFGIKLPFDHAALFISYGGNDYGYFYSFGANQGAGAYIILGTPGYLSTACDQDVWDDEGHPQHQIYYSTIVSTGEVYIDKIPSSGLGYGEDEGYYRSINFTVPSGNEIYLRTAAEVKRVLAGEYMLLWKNCYDKACEILATRNIVVEYDWTGTAVFITEAIIAVAALSPPLAFALEISLLAGTVAEGQLDIPNMAYDAFIQVSMNGNPLPPPSGSQSRTPFRER
jgi:hypothetical protein